MQYKSETTHVNFANDTRVVGQRDTCSWATTLRSLKNEELYGPLNMLVYLPDNLASEASVIGRAGFFVARIKPYSSRE